MSPEQQYVAFMDAAYAATDKEYYYKCIQKAEQILKYSERNGANETPVYSNHRKPRQPCSDPYRLTLPGESQQKNPKQRLCLGPVMGTS